MKLEKEEDGKSERGWRKYFNLVLRISKTALATTAFLIIPEGKCGLEVGGFFPRGEAWFETVRFFPEGRHGNFFCFFPRGKKSSKV